MATQVQKPNGYPMRGTPAIAVGITFLFLISMGMSYIQVIMPGLYQAFPDIPASSVTYIMSMTPLAGVFSGFAAGALVARRIIGYKPLAIIGTILFFIGGTSPVLFHSSFTFLLVSRAVLGIGMGCMSVLGNPLIVAFFEGDARTKLISVCSAAGQIGAMAMQFFAGVLADINIWYAFGADCISILSIIGAVFLIKEPDPSQLPDKPVGNRGALPGRVWYCAVLFFVSTLALMPVLFNFAVIVSKYSQSVTLASTVQIAYTISMIIGGLVYAFVVKRLGRQTIGVACVVAAAGILMLYLAPNLACIYVAMFVTGLGYSMFLPAFLQIVGVVTEPTLVGFATSIVMGLMNIASFVVSPYLGVVEALTGDAILTPILFSVGIFVVLAVVTFVFSPYPANMKEEN